MERIKALAHPAYACNRHEAMPALEGGRVFSTTIQKILNENALGTRIERWGRALAGAEKTECRKVIEIAPLQAAFLDMFNPCYRERHVESVSPGELLSTDTVFIGNLKGVGLNGAGLNGVGKVYLHAVAVTFGSDTFDFLRVSKQPEAVVAVLHNDVLPFYRNLDLNGIEHRRTKFRTPKTNGFVERVNATVLDAFFRLKMHRIFHGSVDALLADLDVCPTTETPNARISAIGHGTSTHRNRHVIRKPRRLSGQTSM